jgi:hypothetical protein
MEYMCNFVYIIIFKNREIMRKIDCKNYTPKIVLSLLRANNKFNHLIADGKKWDLVINYVKSKLSIDDLQEDEIKRYYKYKNR